MPRLIMGGVLGGFAMWLVGFLFWGTPLSMIALSTAPDASNAAIQATLAQHLGPLGTGSYPVPSPGTPLGTELYGRGPVAIVHYTNSGFPVMDGAALVGGLVLAILVSLIVAAALNAVALGLSFANRLRLVGLFALAIAGYTDLGQPIFNHAPWDYFIYMFVSDLASWLAAGAVIAWALPKPVTIVSATG